jgi:hypothetical protein
VESSPKPIESSRITLRRHGQVEAADEAGYDEGELRKLGKHSG